MSQSFQNRIIKNNEDLKESHVPEQLLHRIDHLKLIAKSVEPILKGKDSKTVLVHGPSGSGKTTTTRFFLKKLKEEDQRVKSCYVNCWDNYTRFDLLKKIALGLGLKIIQSVSSNELIFRIQKLTETNPCCVVLDELDQLEQKRVLYSLASLNLSLILVVNDDHSIFRIDERIKSRLGVLERVHFPSYKWQEIQDIIEMRVGHALMPLKLNKAQIRRIALCSGGNAHLALESLRKAANRAEDENSERILDEHVEFSVDKARRVARSKSFGMLNEHQKLLLQIIQDRKEISAADLHKIYRERCQEPVTERAVRNYLHKLQRFGFIRMKGLGRWRVHFDTTK